MTAQKPTQQSQKTEIAQGKSWEQIFFKLFGYKIEELFRKDKKYNLILKSIGLKKTVPEYVTESLSIAVLIGAAMSIMLTLITVLALYVTLHQLLILYAIPILLILYFILGVFAIMGIYYIIPYFKYSARGAALEKEYPFVMRYLEALSTTGVPPVIMFEILAKSQVYTESAKEAQKVVALCNSGYDIITSLIKVSEMTPSPRFRQFFVSLASTIQAGGSLEIFFNTEAQKAQKMLEMQYKQFEGIMGMAVQMIVMVVVVMPLLLFSVLLPLKMFQSMKGVKKLISMPTTIDPKLVILAVTFLVVPMITIMFMFIIKSKAP